MEFVQSASRGKSKQRFVKTEDAEDLTLDRALSELKKFGEFGDEEGVRKALKTFLIGPSLRHQPAACSPRTKVGARAYTEQQTRKLSQHQHVNGQTDKTPTAQHGQVHNHSVASSFHSLSTYDDDATDVEPEMYDDNLPYVGKPISFKIGDEEAVLNFVNERCRRLQQVPMKKIAKLWIKGICPRKQAVFPYSTNKDGAPNKDERQPRWWPADNCKFKEPDHVGRDERNHLCIHLLRLRPTVDQLVEWNGGKMVPNEIHERQGWTKFLASLAPVSCLEELREKNKDKAARRRVLLQQLYDVAQMEEEYRDGGRDATDIFTYTDPVGHIAPSKRPRKSRGIAKGNTVSSTASCDRNPTSAKRQRCLPTEGKRHAVKDEIVANDVDTMEIDPELCPVSDNKSHANMTTSPSRVGTCSTTAASGVDVGNRRDKVQQDTAKPDQPWSAVRDVACDPEYRQHKPIYPPRPIRSPPTAPHENNSWVMEAQAPNMIPPYPRVEIPVYQMRGPPQPQFNPTPGQHYFPFNDPISEPIMAGLPALGYEQGDFIVQQFPTAPVPSPASAGPSTSFDGYYGYPHPPMADQQVHNGWWTFPPADPNTAWPAGLPELSNESNQQFH